MGSLNIQFQLRPNSLPIAIGFVVVGLVLLSIFIVFKSPGTGGGSLLFGVLFSSAFILLGIWLLYTLVVKRRETPQALSEQGVELYGGTILPWVSVSAIVQRPPTFPSGNLLEQTDIKFDDGGKASVSSDWVTNFFDVNEFLVKKSGELGIKRSDVSPIRSALVQESSIAAPTGQEIASPVLPQSQKDPAEIGSIAVEFSMAQYIYVALITPGSIIFGIYLLSLFLSPSIKITGWTFYLLLLVPIMFMILGVAFPFMMSRGRKKIARSFSAEGVKIWNGSVIPWKDVNVIAGGSEFISTGKGGGATYRKLDIQFRDGSSVYVSGYWASNFSELENYLAQMPQYSP